MRLLAFTILIILTARVHAQTDTAKSYIPLATMSSIKNIDLGPGQRDIELKLGNRDVWKASISVPNNINTETKLVLALHWYGPVGDHKVFADCLAFPAFKDKNALVIAPASENGQWLGPVKEKQLYYLVKRLVKHLQVGNPECYLLGYSNGAIGVWNLAKKYPEIFKKGIAISGIYDKEKVEIPFVWIHGKQDELFAIERIREMYSSIKSKKGDLQLIEVSDKGHYEACSYLDELADIVSKNWFN